MLYVISEGLAVDTLHYLAICELQSEAAYGLEIHSGDPRTRIEQKVQWFARPGHLYGHPNQAIAILKGNLVQNLRSNGKRQEKYSEQSEGEQSHLMPGSKIRATPQGGVPLGGAMILPEQPTSWLLIIDQDAQPEINDPGCFWSFSIRVLVGVRGIN
jgi:hypothetical protein